MASYPQPSIDVFSHIGRADEAQGETTAASAVPQALTSQHKGCEVCFGVDLAEISQFSIVTYERRPGHWRAAITPYRPSSFVVRGKTTSSFVTPDDCSSESDAKVAAEKIIRKL
jgi:hypothetical protein